MKTRGIISKFFALFLTIGLAAPQPAWALRSMNAGSEESPVHRRLETVLSPAAGAEDLYSEAEAEYRRVSESVQRDLQGIQVNRVDVVVGIPFSREDDAIVRNVLDQITEGFRRYYPGMSFLIFAAGEKDSSVKLDRIFPAETALLRNYGMYKPALLKGKGWSVRLFMDAASLLKVDLLLFDADLTNITPEWVRITLDPVLSEKGGSSIPTVDRSAHDAEITNHIVYPLLAALYGEAPRHPLSGVRAISSGLVSGTAARMGEVNFETYARYGIDSFLTQWNLRQRAPLHQPGLGPLSHTSALLDVGDDLLRNVSQIVGAAFQAVLDNEAYWVEAQVIPPALPVAGGERSWGVAPNQTTLAYERMFKTYFNQFRPVIQGVLEPKDFRLLEDLSGRTADSIGLDDETWARFFYQFLLSYAEASPDRREEIIQAFFPVFCCRFIGYTREVPEDAPPDQVEKFVQQTVDAMKRQRGGFISRWRVHAAGAEEIEAPEKLQSVAERMVEQIFSEKGLEIIPLDGDTANGKNTLGQKVLEIASAQGRDVVLLDQDRFNLPHAVRVALWKALAGKLPAEEWASLPEVARRVQPGKEFLGDAELLNWSQFLDVLRQIEAFRRSGKGTLKLALSDLFSRGETKREELPLELTQNTKVILIGKYLHHRPETEPLYSPRLRYRAESGPAVIWERYHRRTKAVYQHDEEEMALMENYYWRGMRPSFDRYRVLTERLITHRLLLDQEPYRIIRAKGGGLKGKALVQSLKDPSMTGGVTKRWRYLTGEGDTYDALVRDVLPDKSVPALAGGLGPLLDQLEREAAVSGRKWTWVDGAGGLGNAQKEARLQYPNLRPTLIDGVDWSPGDFPADIIQRLGEEAAQRGVQDLWDKKQVNFIQSDLSTAVVESPTDAPIRLITIFQALGYTDDPIGILVNFYNQLAPDGYLLVNTYIPTNHPKSEQLLQFYEEMVRNLRVHGILAEIKILDQRRDPLPAQKRKPGYDQYQIGLVLRKQETSPRAIVLRLEPKAPEAFAMQWTSRAGQYAVVEYEGDFSRPFLYIPTLGDLDDLPERIRTVPLKDRVLVLETGGTWMRAALVDAARGEILVSLPDEIIEDAGNAQRVLELMERRLQRILFLSGIRREEVGAVSLSTAGDLDEGTGHVRLQKKLPFTGQNIRDLVRQRVGGPVYVMNDVVAAVRAEALYGAGRGRRFVAYLTVSTGTNAAYRTSLGKAVDLHLWNYRVSGGRTVEELSSGTHLARLARERIIEPGGQQILKFAGENPEAITGEHIAQAFRQGNQLAVDLVENSARILGQAIAEAMRQIGQAEEIPAGEEILWVIGGGVGQGLGQPFVDLIQTHVPSSVRVVLSEMAASQRGLLGAAARVAEASGLEEIVQAAERANIQGTSAVVLDAAELERVPELVPVIRQFRRFSTRLVLLGESDLARRLAEQAQGVQYVSERSPDAIMTALERIGGRGLGGVSFFGPAEASIPVRVVAELLSLNFERPPVSIEMILRGFGVDPELAAELAAELDETLGLAHEA